MKKNILTQMMVLSFAVGGLFLVGNNVKVSANETGESEINNGTIKYCMRTGGGIMVYARPCLDPGFPTLPQHKCGQRIMIWNGLRYEQCY